MFQKKSSTKNLKAVGVLVILGLSNLTYAQKPISLQEAADMALANNLLVKNERLRTEYQKQLIGSSKTINPTTIVSELGQVNSYYSDMRFSLGQTLSFPKVYSSQKAYLTEEWKSSILQVGLQESNLKRAVAQAYFNLVYLEEKRQLLNKLDSLYAGFLEKSTLRFEKGESNLLEKTTAESQRGQLSLQLTQLQQDVEMAHLEFQLLLNSEERFSPIDKLMTSDWDNSNETEEHPYLKFYHQQQNIAETLTQIEKSKLLPELILGYNLMGMKGMGANDKVYDRTPRFQSIQLGLGIPIFNKAQKAKIDAAKINEKVTKQQFEAHSQQFENERQVAYQQFLKYEESVRYYQSLALDKAKTITSTANTQFLKGEIDYLSWFMLVNQAAAIQNEYIETVHNRNAAAIEFNYFRSK